MINDVPGLMGGFPIKLVDTGYYIFPNDDYHPRLKAPSKHGEKLKPIAGKNVHQASLYPPQPGGGRMGRFTSYTETRPSQS